MWKTVLRRLIIMIPQLLILSMIVFALGQFMPGDPFTGLFLGQEMDMESLDKLREEAGLNDPLPEQYIRWMKGVLKGDFGLSYTHRRPVRSLIGERVSNTVSLSFLTVLINYMIAIPLGMIAGRYNGSKADRVIVAYNFIALAMPTFIFALLMLLVFGFRLKVFPTSGSVQVGIPKGTFAYYRNRLYHMILPALSSALIRTTGTIQYLRNEIIDAKTQDYVKTARSKGIPTKKVYTKHIFRNSILPIAAFFGFTITGLLGGSVFIETIFGYSGMGSLFIESIDSRDYSTINTLVLLFGMASLVGSLLSDIIMSIVDPRIRIH